MQIYYELFISATISSPNMIHDSNELRNITKLNLSLCHGYLKNKVLVSKETVVLHWRASETLTIVSYQHEVDKGKFTAVARFETLTF